MNADSQKRSHKNIDVELSQSTLIVCQQLGAHNAALSESDLKEQQYV